MCVYIYIYIYIYHPLRCASPSASRPASTGTAPACDLGHGGDVQSCWLSHHKVAPS